MLTDVTFSDGDMTDDDFEALDFDDCSAGSDSDSDLGGWVVFGSSASQKENTRSAIATQLQTKLKSRGSPDQLRNRGILREQQAQANYIVGSCPGDALSDLKGTAIYCSKKQIVRNERGLESQRARMLRLILERSFNASRRPAPSNWQKKNNYFVGQGPGVVSDGANFSSKTSSVQRTATAPMGRNYFVGTGPGSVSIGTKTETNPVPLGSNYYVSSGPGIQCTGCSGVLAKGPYFQGECPGVEMSSSKHTASAADDAASAAYRQAFTPSAAKIIALEKGLLRTMQHHNPSDPRIQRLARHLSRGKVSRQLERARYARARGHNAKRQGCDRDQQLRHAFSPNTGRKFAPPRQNRPQTAPQMSPLLIHHFEQATQKQAPKKWTRGFAKTAKWAVPPTTFYSDCEVEAGGAQAAPTHVGKNKVEASRNLSREDMIRQAFIAEQKIKAAQKEVLDFGIGGRTGSGSGIAMKAEKNNSREDMIRQAFITEQKIKAAQKEVLDFGIGGRTGSGSGIAMKAEKNNSREDMIRQAFITEQKIKAAQKEVLDFGIGGRIGSGSGIAMKDEAEDTRSDLLRQAFVQEVGGGSRLVHGREAERTVSADADETSLPGNRKAKRKLKKKLRKQKGKKTKVYTGAAGGFGRICGSKGTMVISKTDADVWARAGYAGGGGGNASPEASMARKMYQW